MKFSKIMLALGTFALIASAAANTYHVKLDDTAWIGATKVQAGDYKIQVEGNKAVMTSGKKDVAQFPVKVEQADHKFPSSEIFMRTDNNKQNVQEFRIGGTTTRIIVQSSGQGVE